MPCRKITHCPKIERLERRRLLAAAFDASTNTLTVTGTEAADDISVEAFSSSARVTANGVTDEFYPAQIEHVKIFALGGADHVQFDTSPSSSGKTVELTTDLGSGNDTFTATGGAVTVNGGAGDDTVTGSYYRDLLNGGDGNDSLNGSWGIDTVNGNAGTDAGFNDGLDALVSIENKIDAKGSGQVTADGTLLIQGTNGADQLSLYGISTTTVEINGTRYPLFQDDDSPLTPAFTRVEIRGLGGDDHLFGDETSFNHTLPTPTVVFDGGSGNDLFELVDFIPSTIIIGGGGNDVLQLRESSRAPTAFSDVSGIDKIDATEWTPGGGPGVVDLRLYPTIENASNTTSIIGNDLDNILTNIGTLDQYPSTLSGGKGNDILRSDSYFTFLDGGDGNDRLFASGYGSTLDGGNGNDSLFGGSYNDTLLGGAGDDLLDGRGGGDLMKGGAGSDWADYSARTASVVVGIGTLADDGEAGEKDNVYNDIEKVRGGKGNDRLNGSAGANVLYGGAGNDVLLGNGGADALFGEAGNDSLDGGDANDYLDGGSGNDTLRGGAGIDKFFGWDGNDIFYTRDGNKETVNGGNGTDKAQRDAFDVLFSVEATLP